MKLIPLSVGGSKNKGKYFAMVDNEDYEELSKFRWTVKIKPENIYAVRHEGKVLVQMHRQIMKPHFTEDRFIADHIDHNGLNNQRSNLRIATPSENSANCTTKYTCNSLYRGTYKTPYGKWVAQIFKNRKRIYLGSFEAQIDAAKAYNEAAKIQHGEFAMLNNI